MAKKFSHISDNDVIDLSSDEDINRLTNPEDHAKKNLPKATIRQIIAKSENILTFVPDSPDFFKGVRVDGIKQSSGWFDFKQKGTKKKLDAAVDEARRALNEFLERHAIDPRKKLKTFLEKYDQSPDLHAIWAIYVFNTSKDFSDSKNVSKSALNRMDEDRLKTLKKALQEMMSAFFSECLTVYYTSWFIQIYNEYLMTLNRILKYNYAVLSQEEDKRIEEIVRKIFQGQKKVAAMVIKKEELESFNVMSRAIANSGFTILNLVPNKIKETIIAREQGEDKDLTAKASVDSVTPMLLVILTIFVRVSIFSQKKLILNLLNQIPGSDGEMEIRKHLVILAQHVADYKLAYAAGDLNSKRSAMQTIYKYALNIVEKHMEGSVVPSKWHANVLLRIGWVAINAQDEVIFEKSEYQKVLKTAFNCLGWIITNCTILPQPKGGEANAEKLKQNLTDKAYQLRGKITAIGKTVGLELDNVSE